MGVRSSAWRSTPAVAACVAGARYCAHRFRIATRGAVIAAVAALSFAAQPASAQSAYVPNFGSNTVSVIATASNTVAATIPVGSGPFGVAATPDGGKVYVANQNSNTVSVIETASNTVEATIAIGGSNLSGVAVSPDGRTVYVTSNNPPGGGNPFAFVAVIATASNTVEATIALPPDSEPYGVVVTPDGSKVYVVNSENRTVSVIATASNTVEATIPVGDNPQGVAVSPDGSTVYVTNFFDSTVSVIATATNTVETTIAVPGPSGEATWPYGVAVSPDGSTVYVADNFLNTVSVIATTTNTVTTTVAVGNHPAGVAVTPDGSTVYVANTYDNTVSVIATASNTATATVAVGTSPIALGSFIQPPAGPPAVTLISPSSGPAGTSVTITGTGFTSTSAVEFGGTLALFQVNSGTSITAIAPAGSGIVDVTVTTPLGTSPTSAADQFTYIATLTLTSTASSTTQVGQSYSQTNVAGGGTPSYTYAVTAGELPAGTSLNTSSGTVSGTPTTAGAFSYTIEVTDSTTPTAQTATQVVSGTINPLPSLSPSSLPADTTGVAYNQTITATGGTGAHTITISNVSGPVPGVNLSGSGSSSIAITGTPTASGTESFTATVTDSVGATASTNYSLTVNPVPSLSPSSLSAGTVGLAVNQTITATGGTGALTITISNVSGPVPGVSLSGSGTPSIAITGTPTATGTESFTATVTDSLGATASQNFALTINPPPPTVTAVAPNSGSTAGGTGVTITGTNLTGATAVKFGGVAATNVNVVSGTSITAASPAGSAGAVDVTVTTAGGTSPTGAADKFTYNIPGRSWVSAGSGNDANPCSLASPCLTFAAALTNTTAGGEIDVLTPGDYGPVTITKAISIYNDGAGVAGALATTGTSGITINAGANDDINLRGLSFNGLTASGASGIVFNSGAQLHIDKCTFQGFATSGITFAPGDGSAATAAMVVEDTTLIANTIGLSIKPTGGIAANVALRHIKLDKNIGGGLSVDGTGDSGAINAMLADSSASLNAGNGITATGGPNGVTLNIMRVVAASNGAVGIQSSQSDGGTATVTVGKSTVYGNAVGVQSIDGGALLSYANTQLTGNANNGSFTGTTSLQ
jgi:YVTN family beta-propeller protein